MTHSQFKADDQEFQHLHANCVTLQNLLKLKQQADSFVLHLFGLVLSDRVNFKLRRVWIKSVKRSERRSKVYFSCCRFSSEYSSKAGNSCPAFPPLSAIEAPEASGGEATHE